MNRMCARLLNNKIIHTVKCVGSRVSSDVMIVLMFAPVILTIYLHVLRDSIVNKDLT